MCYHHHIHQKEWVTMHYVDHLWKERRKRIILNWNQFSNIKIFPRELVWMIMKFWLTDLFHLYNRNIQTWWIWMFKRSYWQSITIVLMISHSFTKIHIRLIRKIILFIILTEKKEISLMKNRNWTDSLLNPNSKSIAWNSNITNHSIFWTYSMKLTQRQKAISQPPI